MQIFPDPILVAVMVIPFLITLTVLHFLLFRPLVGYLEARADARNNAIKEARALDAQVAERTADLQKRLEAARSEASALRASERAKAMAIEAELLAAARAKAEEKIEAALTEIQSSSATARQDLKTTASTLSNEIAAQVLGRELRA